MTILIPDMPEEETATAVERLLNHIANNGGQIKDHSTESPWGRRRLAYTMRFQGVDYRDGHYVLTHFSAAPDAIAEIERELKLDNQVIRYLLVWDDPRMGEKPQDGQTAADEQPAEGESAAPAGQAEADAAPAEAQPEGDATSTESEAEGSAEVTEGADEAQTEDADTAKIAEVAEAIEGEENPAPADAPAARRSSKLPTEGEGTEWVAGDGTADIPEGFPLKANTTSKIYHPQESPNYNTTTGEIFFATPEAAEKHGYRLPKTLQAAAAATEEPAGDAAEEE